MFFWQIAFFFLLAEAFTLFLVIGKIGFFKTLLFCVCGVMGGSFLIQRQGTAVFAKMQNAFVQKAVPVDNLFGNLLLVFAGILFIVPGFISDVLAALLLIPFIQNHFKTYAGKHFRTHTQSTFYYDDGVIDGNYVRVEETQEKIEQVGIDGKKNTD